MMIMGLENAKTARKRTYDDWDKNVMDDFDSNNGKSCPNDKHPGILLQDLLDQFEAEFSSAEIHISQQQIRVLRETTAKILKMVQKIMLKSTRRSGVTAEVLAYKEVRLTLEILIDRWGLGDIQIYNVLAETLLQTYLYIPNADTNIVLQEFILLDMLPYATGGDSDNCHHLQSAIAKLLMQALSKCGKNCGMYKPIICWCKWFLNFQQYYKPYSILSSEAPSNNNSAASFLIPTEIFQLGIELLRNVPSIDLLSSALSVNLDFVAALSNSDFKVMRTFSIQHHSRDIIVTLRQRWTEMMLPRDLMEKSADVAMTSEANTILECQLQLLNIFEEAILDQDIKQGYLLTDAYVKCLQAENSSDRDISELHSLFITPRQTTKKKTKNDSSSLYPDCCNVDMEIHILTIDWIFVIMLLTTQKYQTMAIKFIDTWCVKEACDSLSYLIDIVFVNRCKQNMERKGELKEFQAHLPNISLDNFKHKPTQERLAWCLLRMATVLLLKPLRGYRSHNGISSASSLVPFRTDSSTVSLMFGNKWILSLLVHLDYHQQKEFINMLLHITDECLFYGNPQGSEKSCFEISLKLENRHEATGTSYLRRAVSTVVRSIFTVLHHIAQTNPLIIHLKSKLIECLALPASSDTASLLNSNVDREICMLLVSLMKPRTARHNFAIENGCTHSEALLLLQTLLFGETSCSNTTFAIRGIIFATELLSIRHDFIISIEEQKLVREWVLRCLLPCTRRMLEPELGLTGLSFLKGWVDSNSNEALNMAKSSFFLQIKMMVANTGLVQVLNSRGKADTLKESKDVALAVFAYSPAIESRSARTKQESAREMFFGTNFFLRRTNDIIPNPKRWSPTTDWVYALVNTYLRMGRSVVSKGWNPLNWLRAPLEFPIIDTSFFNPSHESQRLIVEFIDQKLCQFELSQGMQSINSFPASYADLVVSRLFSKKLKMFIDSLTYFAVALLIGISLSAAVLKNAYEHAQSTNSISLDFRKFTRLQIIKIYDLRAKSVTMDSLFSSIDSALRRSLLRKKRVVVLINDSSDNGTCSVSSSARRNQGNEILDSLHSILNETHSVRKVIFAGTKYIGSEILWSALMDTSESDLIRKSLESIVYCVAHKEVRQLFLKLSYSVGTKLHIIQQILEQLENFSLSQHDSAKANIQYCFNEISFFIPWITRLRKGCTAIKRIKNEMIDSYVDESIALLVRFTSSFLQVIALFLQGIHRRSGVHQDKGTCDSSNLSLTEFFIHLDTYQLNTGESDATNTTIRRLFNFFTDHLRSTDYAEVANSIFEILSAIAVFDDHLMIQLFGLSWVHLHSVYVHTESNQEPQLLSCPFSVGLSVSELARQSNTNAQQSNLQIVNGIINKLVRFIKHYDSHFLYLHVGLIRHWGLLMASAEIGFPFLLQNFIALAANLNTFLDSFDVSVTRQAETLDSDEYGTRKVTGKSPEVPRVFGLDASTFPMFFKSLLNLVIATAASLALGQLTSNWSTNSCQYIIESFGIFRSLIDTYKDHINLFPSTTILTIYSGSNDILRIAVRQLKLCDEWRHDQPLQPSNLQATGVHDADAVISELMDRTLSYTTAPILSLCDVWQKSTNTINKKKLSSLRLAAEKAVRQIKDISQSHNISRRPIRVDNENFEATGRSEEYVSRPNRINREQSVFVSLDSCKAIDCDFPESIPFDLGKDYIKEDDNNSNCNSFGVMGNWGDASYFDDENNSICSLNIENPGSSM